MSSSNPAIESSENPSPDFDDTLDATKLGRYTDAELMQYITRCSNAVTTRVEGPIKVLSSHLIAKSVRSKMCHDEIAALKFSRDLGIRVPVVHRVVEVDAEKHDYIIIMERIHGHTLEELWPSIGWWRTLLLAKQLRSYLQIMHSITSMTAGGLSSGSVRSPWLESLYAPAPHSSPAAFTGYLNWWLLSCRPYRFKARTDLAFEHMPNHIFIHQDLAPRNLIVDAHNNLWVVDWEYAGFYPPYMEYVNIDSSSMAWLNGSSWRARLAKWRWALLRWIAAGPPWHHIKYWKGLAEIHRRSCIYRLDRTPYSEQI